MSSQEWEAREERRGWVSELKERETAQRDNTMRTNVDGARAGQSSWFSAPSTGSYILHCFVPLLLVLKFSLQKSVSPN